MTLYSIVAALGGDLYAGGRRASIPAPGHSAADRSVSLLLSGDRLIVHGFADADWRAVREYLAGLGFVDETGRLRGGGSGGLSPSVARPGRAARIAAAARLWDGVIPVAPGSLSHRHLLRRSVGLDPVGLQNLGHHPAAPLSVFDPGGSTRPALVAGITDPDGRPTAIELVYLDPNGRRASRLRLSRKTVGVVPPGSAVRLWSVSETLLVGEGVFTVLSACERFGLPGWALLSAHNLSVWTPPAAVRRVVIAADRGPAGESAAARLAGRLVRAGRTVSVVLPPEPHDDWNAAAGKEEEGR